MASPQRFAGRRCLRSHPSRSTDSVVLVRRYAFNRDGLGSFHGVRRRLGSGHRRLSHNHAGPGGMCVCDADTASRVWRQCSLLLLLAVYTLAQPVSEGGRPGLSAPATRGAGPGPIAGSFWAAPSRLVETLLWVLPFAAAGQLSSDLGASSP